MSDLLKTKGQPLAPELASEWDDKRDAAWVRKTAMASWKCPQGHRYQISRAQREAAHAKGIDPCPNSRHKRPPKPGDKGGKTMWHMPVPSCKSCVPGHPGMEPCECQLGFPPGSGEVCHVCMGTKMIPCGQCEQWWAAYQSAAAQGRRPPVDDVINARAKTVHLHRGRPRQKAPYEHRIPAWTGSPIPLSEEPRRFHPMFLQALAEDAAALRRGSRVFQCVVTMDRLGRGREFWRRFRRILDRGYLERQAQYASYKAHMDELGLLWDAEASNWRPRS